MRKLGLNPVTAQRKIISNADKFGNSGIKKQQGTTRAIYDTLPIDGRTTFRFFEESNNRNFPFTNTGADGNKLPVGNALAVERAYFSIVNIDENGSVLNIFPLATATANVRAGELSFEIANSQVIKQVPVASFLPDNNKSSQHVNNQNFEFDTQLVINPLLEFVFTLKINQQPAIADTFIRLTIEGTGAIIAPRATF
jgi:hypothetical protein